MGAIAEILFVVVCTYLALRVKFTRLLAFGFVVSVFWNWVYLYRVELAKHQRNMIDAVVASEQCSGRDRSVTWLDNLKDWYRRTWTLQDDPCATYYETLAIHPLLLVSPIKPLLFTTATLFAEPCKEIGNAIGDFVRALLKDLPITLQIPVLFSLVVVSLVLVYTVVVSTFRYGLSGLFQNFDQLLEQLDREDGQTPLPLCAEQPIEDGERRGAPADESEAKAPLRTGDSPFEELIEDDEAFPRDLAYSPRHECSPGL